LVQIAVILGSTIRSKKLVRTTVLVGTKVLVSVPPDQVLAFCHNWLFACTLGKRAEQEP
jgi:hypothetical protein